MAKPKCYEIHLFAKFTMCLFVTPDDYNKACKINNIEDTIDENTLGRALINTSNGLIKFAMYIRLKDFNYGNVIHESTHIVDFLMDEVGINDMEFRAYMIEDLSVRVIDKIQKIIDKQGKAN